MLLETLKGRTEADNKCNDIEVVGAVVARAEVVEHYNAADIADNTDNMGSVGTGLVGMMADMCLQEPVWDRCLRKHHI